MYYREFKLGEQIQLNVVEIAKLSSRLYMYNRLMILGQLYPGNFGNGRRKELVL